MRRGLVLVLLTAGVCAQTGAGLTLPKQLDFGEQAVDSTGEPIMLAPSNPTHQPIAMGLVLATGEFRVVENACSGRTLAPAQACGLEVVFKPKSEGERTGTLTFTSGAAQMKQMISLRGVGVAY